MDIESVFNSVGKRILWTSYEHLFASVLMAFLFSLSFLYFRRVGIKKTMLLWIKKIKTDNDFRNAFIMAFVVAMLLYETLLCRISFKNPFNDVWGNWGFHDKDGSFSSGNIQNICLFVLPIFIMLLLYSKKIFAKRKETFLSVCRLSAAVSFSASLSIELIQVFMFLGMFQLSDLCYNTLGGLIGAIMYYIINKIRKRGTKFK